MRSYSSHCSHERMTACAVIRGFPSRNPTSICRAVRLVAARTHSRDPPRSEGTKRVAGLTRGRMDHPSAQLALGVAYSAPRVAPAANDPPSVGGRRRRPVVPTGHNEPKNLRRASGPRGTNRA